MWTSLPRKRGCRSLPHPRRGRVGPTACPRARPTPAGRGLDQAASTLKTALVYDTYSAWPPTAARTSTTAPTTTGRAWAPTTAIPPSWTPWGWRPCPSPATPKPPCPTPSTAPSSPPPACGGSAPTASTPIAADGVTVTSHTYDNKGNPVEEERPLYDASFLSVKDKYSMFLGGNQPLAVVAPTPTPPSSSSCGIPTPTAWSPS